MRLPIRVRLTLWHVALLSLTLLVWGMGTGLLLERSRRSDTEASLRQARDSFVEFLTAEAHEEAALSPDEVAREAVAEYRSRGWAAAVYGADGRRVAPAPQAAPDRVSPLALPPMLSRRDPRRFGAVVEHGEVTARLLASPIHIRNVPFTLVVAQPTEEEQEVLEQLRAAFLLSAPIILLLAGLGGYILAVRALAPVDAMSREASRIGAGNLHARLPGGDPGDELGRLAAVLNELLSRLQRAFEQQRQFMADASHELRTPVAVIRGEAEVALSRDDRSADELREALQIAGDEAVRLTRIVEDLFTLARADAGQHTLIPENFYLDELFHECIRAMRTLAAQEGVELRCEAPAEAPIRADEALLRRMILNLLDNALKHTPTGGTVRLTLSSAGDRYRIRVLDTGTGIPAEVRPYIFDRFVRADPARSRRVRREGAGLGLSIARWIAEAHGGTLDLVASGPEGTELAATLPASPPARTTPQSPAYPAFPPQ